MTPTKTEVLNDVTMIARDVLGNQSIKLGDETTAKDVQEWDSLHHIELIIAIERHFRIKFNFTELQKFKNVGEMCNNIVAKLGSGRS